MPFSNVLRRARIAASAIFFANGMVLAIWATNIPGMKQALALTDAELGFALSAFAAGTMLTLYLAGALVTRLGSRNTLLLGGVLVALVLPLCAFVGSALALAVAIFLLGVTNSVLDVSMNTHGALVEAQRGRPLMSSFHAVFSIGGLVGASTVATLLSDSLGLMQCLLFAGAVMGVTTLLSARFLGNLLPQVAAVEEGTPARTFAWPNKLLLCIAGLTFLALFIERTVIDWSALFLTDVSHASSNVAAFAFGAFSLAMAVGRLSGDFAIRRFGANRVLAVSGAVGGLGMALAIAVPQPLASIAGFILVGMGLANMTPLLYSQASRAYPDAPGLGLAMNGTLGYAGFLLAPPVIGYLSGAVGLQLAMILPVAAFVLLMSSHLRKSRRERRVESLQSAPQVAAVRRA
ncbi:MFS transporter [Pseudomonas sp. NPDC090202]|uniref:MFS transporter n=1 Tax=unclassified Pseudomonas TaxID=196821 RepID=UPI0037FADD99